MTPPLVAVTGAGSGIGLAVANAFEAEGHPVCGLSLEDGVDVTDYAALEKAIRAGEAEHGPTACLVSSAGTFDMSEFHEAEPERYARDVRDEPDRDDERRAHRHRRHARRRRRDDPERELGERPPVRPGGARLHRLEVRRPRLR